MDSQSTCSITAQRILLDINLQTKQVLGFTTIHIYSPTPPVLHLSIDNLEIDQVLVAGTSIPIQIQPNTIRNRHSGQTLLINVENLDPSQIIIDIHFRISQSHQKYFHFKTFEGVEYPYFVGTNQTGLFFPCFNTEFHKASSWTLSILTPLMYPIDVAGRQIELQAIGSGILAKNIIDSHHNKRIFVFEHSDHPVSSIHMGVVVGYLDTIILSNNPCPFQMYCYPGKHPKLALLTEYMSKAFEFYNWIVNTISPFSTLSLVFLDETRTFQSFSTVNSNLLYDKTNIDQTYVTKLEVCRIVSLHYFWRRFDPVDLADTWLLVGLSRYIADLYLEKLLGNNEVHLRLKRDMDRVCVLDIDYPPLYEWKEHMDPEYVELVLLKSTLVIHMIEAKIGKTSMISVLNSVYGSVENNEMSTISFLRLIRKVSGKDLKEFAEQWIYRSGTPKFLCSFLFNRKKTVIEMCIQQSRQKTGRLFVGPLKIRIHEFEGTYDYSVHIEEETHQIELPCHAKQKRSRSKFKEEEKESSLEFPGSGLPIAWIRVDPDMEWIRIVEVQQPDFMWIEQLYRDKDVIAQTEAILALTTIPSGNVFSALDKTVSDWKLYYQIRCMAITAMATMATTVPSMKDEVVSHLLTIFERKFCLQRTSPTDPLVVKGNNFENLANYFIQKTIIDAMGKIKDINGKTPLEIQRFLVNLLKYNDNSHNQFSDYAYISTIIQSLADSLIPASSDPLCKPDGIILKDAIVELERYRFIDMIEPRYHNSITTSVIQASTKLQLVGLLHVDKHIYLRYLHPENFIDVRIAALEAILLLSHSDTIFDHVFHAMRSDPSRLLRQIFCSHLSKLASLTTSWTRSLGSDAKKILDDLLGDALASRDFDTADALEDVLGKIAGTVQVSAP